MAANSRVETTSPSALKETPSHFFKIIHGFILEEKKLRLPQKFVREFGHELSDAATLVVPNSLPWSVGLKKEGRYVWFVDGWNEFVERHSIFDNYFLLFKYERNSWFHVRIFDLTACEIDYPYIGEESQIDKQNRAKPTFHTAPGIKMNQQSAASFENSKVYNFEAQSKKGKIDSTKLKTTAHNGKNKHPTGILSNKRKLKMVAYEVGTHSSDDDGVKTSTKSACEIDYQRGFCENVKNLCASTKFKKTKHNVEDEHRTKIVLTGDGKEFVPLLENMGVSISESCKSLSVEDRQRAINFVSFLKPKNPSFIIVMRASDMQKRYMYVPMEFGRKYLSEDERVIVQDSNGKELAIKRIWTGNKCFLTGWSEWIKIKSLMKGDILLFEKIKMKFVVLKLIVFPARVE